MKLYLRLRYEPNNTVETIGTNLQLNISVVRGQREVTIKQTGKKVHFKKHEHDNVQEALPHVCEFYANL